MEYFYAPSEIKASGDEGYITGYGSVTGNIDSYGDIVAPGAFKKTLEESKSGAKAWPAMLSQHGDSTAMGKMPIGVWVSMDEDSKGLKMVGKLAIKTRRGSDAYELLKLKALNGLSIGYRCTDYEIHKAGSPARRTIQAVDLVEVSLVTFPANSRAVVTSVKALGEPLPVVVDWKAVAREDFEALQRSHVRLHEAAQRRVRGR